MVIKNDLSAIVGRHSSRSSDSAMLMPSVPSGMRGFAMLATLRVMRGALPSNTSTGMSTGRPDSKGSVTAMRPSPVISPTTANGQRSRSHSAAKRSRLFGTSART